MKKMNFILFAVLALSVCSCNNKVDLYSDKGDSTVVYMMLDANADTNFAKITKSFTGNANVLAQNYAASNYNYDEIEVRLAGKFGKAYDTIKLDTVSRWIPYNPDAVFYSGCYQTYYYTTEKLSEGQEYKLIINRKDGVTVTSKASTIDDFRFNTPIENYQLNLESEGTNPVMWANNHTGHLKSNASYFEVIGFFRYGELMPGSADTTYHEIRWTFGQGEAESLYNPKTSVYGVSYIPEGIFSILEHDSYLKNNSPYGVKRFIKKMRIDITGIGSEFYNYLIINNSSSAIQDSPNYTNIENGIGLMSSRVTKSRFIIPNAPSRQRITNDFPDYGFVYDPNNPHD